MPFTLPRFLIALPAAATVCLAPAAWAAPPLTAFLEARPEAAVLPAPYFEPTLGPESYLELELAPYRFLPPGTTWRAEVDTGTVTHRAPSTAKRWSAFLPLGQGPIARAELRLYALERSGVWRLSARVAIPTIRPERFNAIYQRGPRGKQLSSAWGEEGAWLVLLQMRHPPRFWRVEAPVLYLGGDFLFQKIEHLVRYLRVHGVNALGYKPDYARDQDEPVLALARSDAPHVRTLLDLAAPGRPAHLVGMCLGGLHGRALIQRDPARFASLAAVAAPHTGSELADLYNAHWLWPFLHRFATGDSTLHQYKDDRPAMAAFNRRVPKVPGFPYYDVVLDPTGHRLDPRYDGMAWTLQRIVAAETGVAPETVRTDGLITVASQAFGERLATWPLDHAGMINDGRSSHRFDVHRAHLELVEALEARAAKGSP